MVDPFSPSDSLENDGFLVKSLWRNENSHRFAHGFLSRVAKQPFRALVPARNDAIEILADDGVVRRFHNSGKPGLRLFSLFAHGDVNVHSNPFAHQAIGIHDRDGSHRHPAPFPAGVPDAMFSFQGGAFGHGALPQFIHPLAVVRMKSFQPPESFPLLIGLPRERSP